MTIYQYLKYYLMPFNSYSLLSAMGSAHTGSVPLCYGVCPLVLGTPHRRTARQGRVHPRRAEGGGEIGKLF